MSLVLLNDWKWGRAASLSSNKIRKYAFFFLFLTVSLMTVTVTITFCEVTTFNDFLTITQQGLE